MQEGPVGWEPAYIHHDLGVIGRLFILFLFAALLRFLFQSIRLAWHLGWFSRYKSALLDEIGLRIHKRELGSVPELADKIPPATPEAGLRPWAISVEPDQIMTALRALRRAEIAFAYAWEACSAYPRSMKKTAILTFVLSLFASTCDVTQLLRGMTMEKVVSGAAVAAGMIGTLTLFAFGLLVCSVLYAGFALYGGVLSRRKARWDHFCACAKEDLAK